jgi:hypothetical protein
VIHLVAGMVEGREEHGGQVEEGLRVQAVIQRQQDGGQEEQVAQGQQQGVTERNNQSFFPVGLRVKTY